LNVLRFMGEGLGGLLRVGSWPQFACISRWKLPMSPLLPLVVVVLVLVLILALEHRVSSAERLCSFSSSHSTLRKVWHAHFTFLAAGSPCKRTMPWYCTGSFLMKEMLRPREAMRSPSGSKANPALFRGAAKESLPPT